MKSDMVVRPSPLPDTAYDREEGVSLSLFYYSSVGWQEFFVCYFKVWSLNFLIAA